MPIKCGCYLLATTIMDWLGKEGAEMNKGKPAEGRSAEKEEKKTLQ